MYLTLLAIISIGAAAYIIWYSENQKKKLAQFELEQRQTKLEAERLFKQQQEDIKNHILNKIESDFEKIGWTEWNGSVHRLGDQYERIKRAAKYDSGLSLTQYSQQTGFGIVRGSSANYYLVNSHRCSCPDFRERQLPCKHMYYLAMVLADSNPETGIPTTKINRNISQYAFDNVLWGLKFDIVGRNQNAVKDFLIKHGGMFGNSSWRETAAVITTGTTETQKLLEAKARNVEILTFEELQNMFDTYTHKETSESDH